MQIVERDLILLSDLLTHGAMLTEHIQALYFHGRSRRRVNQRLRQLHDAGLVRRRPLPLGLSGGLPHEAASGIPWVYALGSAGASLVACRLGWGVEDVRRLIRAGTPTATAHTLEVVALRVRAERAVQERNAQEENSERADGRGVGAGETTLEFLPERLVRHQYQVRLEGGSWRDEVYKPDALLKIAFPGRDCHYFFVEVDLGHTSAPEWEKKALVARRYLRAGLFQKRYRAAGFRTLICTTGERRRTHLQRLLARRLGAEDAARFGLTTFGAITDGLLAPVWHTEGVAGPLALDEWAELPETGSER